MTTRKTTSARHRTAFGLLLAGCLAMAFVDGCSCSEEPQAPTQTAKPTPPPPKPAPKPIAPKPRPKSMREQLEQKVDLVATYPADGPVYPGANVSSSEMRNGRATAVFSTGDSPEDVQVWAAGFAKKNGWNLLPEIPMPDGMLIQGEKQGRQLSILVAPAGNEGLTMLIVAVHP